MPLRTLAYIATGAALLASLVPTVASAHEAQMLGLPSYETFGCLNCHDGNGTTTTSVPAGQEAVRLNSFGVDWLENGREWSALLASLNSDNDGCTNGFELGDPGGAWTPGMPRPDIDPREQRNPGNATDCALPINKQSWGVMKSLFGD